MKITNIEKKKGTRYQVDVDNEYWYILDIEVIYDYHLKAGLEVEESFLAEVKYAAEYRKAKERALYLLGVRDYGRQELIDKLSEKVSYAAAKEAAEKMEELGFLNDKAYAEKLAKHLVEYKHYGWRRARFEMEKNGLSSDVVEEALEGLPDSDLAGFVRRKYARYLGDEAGQKKILASLARLGHSYGTAMAAINEALEEAGEEE